LPPSRLRPEADKGEQRNPAAGFSGLLRQEMQDFQRLSCSSPLSVTQRFEFKEPLGKTAV
jgi:hypothetical protein